MLTQTVYIYIHIRYARSFPKLISPIHSLCFIESLYWKDYPEQLSWTIPHHAQKERPQVVKVARDQKNIKYLSYVREMNEWEDKSGHRCEYIICTLTYTYIHAYIHICMYIYIYIYTKGRPVHIQGQSLFELKQQSLQQSTVDMVLWFDIQFSQVRIVMKAIKVKRKGTSVTN